MRVMKEVISERAARRNQRQLLYQCRFGSPAECPLISKGEQTASLSTA